MATESTLMLRKAQKRPVISPIMAPGRTIRNQVLASNNTRMLVNIMATGRMANVMAKV